ncbi:NAD(P)-dependent oxidoreductase [Nocardioides mesophilus]|uniref:NAD(P)-dependent oxidoreductase n=1 Tax=Nocardioides mesophilus TaxID=433659 RepID=A0A7G9RG37_9ACTN|nr:NAD(P)-dependent oxidoreductase [Nocardioides mesophilus]QNN54562.1 NAD(P)-dependent oxidoreductase [Nocardioides mesophilus]
MTTPTVALLGTGAMGAGMARNIAAAGIPLRVWNRSTDRARPLAESGAKVCDSVAEAVDGADVVITMLWDADSVEQTLREAAGSFAAGAVLLQTTTVGVDGAAQLDKVAAELGLVHLDAPVLGTKGPAEQGNLVVLASGPEDARDRVDAVLEAIGSRTLWVGGAGAGSRLKLAANAFVLSLTGAVAQSLALTRALGLDPQLFLDALAGGPLDAPYVRIKGGAMLAEQYAPAFGIEGGVKDADLILEAARGNDLDPVVLQAVRDQLVRVLEAGHTDEDIAAVYRDYTG